MSEPTIPPTPTLTRAARLERCLAALGPEMDTLIKTGWGTAGAPYAIETLPNGRRRIKIWDPASGDMWVGAGATLDDAITALEAKVLTAPPPDAPATSGGA
jgi:hypothetical protein